MPPSPSTAKKAPGKGKKAAAAPDDDDAPVSGKAKGGDGADAAVLLKVKDLVDSVAEATGTKKPEARKTVEATLSALANAFAAGRAMNLPQLGKLRVVKNNGNVLTVKLRLADAPKAAGLALADDGEDD